MALYEPPFWSTWSLETVERALRAAQEKHKEQAEVFHDARKDLERIRERVRELQKAYVRKAGLSDLLKHYRSEL